MTYKRIDTMTERNRDRQTDRERERERYYKDKQVDQQEK